MNWIYALLLPMAVTLHISNKAPKMTDPGYYGLATCSGVMISPDTMLSAAHCFEGYRNRAWARIEGKSYEVTLVKKDILRDLALIKVKGFKTSKFARLGAPVHIGQEIFTVNSGASNEGTYNKGIVNNLFHDDESYDTLSILHSAFIVAGASGSGLFNSKQELVGINVATIRSVSEAVDILEIRAFLNAR